jgi:hypothetical protein
MTSERLDIEPLKSFVEGATMLSEGRDFISRPDVTIEAQAPCSSGAYLTASRPTV